MQVINSNMHLNINQGSISFFPFSKINRMKFSVDWFSNNIPLWKKHLKKFKDKTTIALEVGSYEGRSASWLLENILTHNNSRIFCIDNFSEGTYNQYIANMVKYKNKVKTLVGNSSEMLKHMDILKHEFDIIYIDANHHSRHVLEDAILSFAVLKVGGILIFDDNTDSKEHDNTCPKPAINAFLNAYAGELKVLHTGWQVIIQKKKYSKQRSCRSEMH